MEYTVKRVSHLNAKTHKFSVKNRETGESREVTCAEYFKEKYRVHLEWPELPLLETNKKGVSIPMELAFMCYGQRYPFKLSESQVCHCTSDTRVIS